MDGNYVKSEDEMSLYTIMLYLNGELEGGTTNFLKSMNNNDNKKMEQNTGSADIKFSGAAEITNSVVPEAGLVLLFQHNMLHEGSAVVSGYKYIMRTDVMFKRIARNTPMDANEAEARYLLKLAENFEINGQPEEAMLHYRKAFKKSEKLAKLYKM